METEKEYDPWSLKIVAKSALITMGACIAGMIIISMLMLLLK